MLRAAFLAAALIGAMPAFASAQASPSDAPQSFGSQASSPALYPPAGAKWSTDPELRSLRHRMRQACATEIQTYCTDRGSTPPVYPGHDAQGPSATDNGTGGPVGAKGGRHGVGRCLMLHQTDLHPDCLAALQQMRDRRREDRASAANGAPATGTSQPDDSTEPR